MKIWLVDFPTHQYKEDVKALARQKGVKIIDKRFAKDIDEKFILTEAECPKLTYTPEVVKAKKLAEEAKK